MIIEREQIQNLMSKNPELKSLYIKHLRLEKELKKYSLYETSSVATPIKRAELKKEKLAGRDQLVRIVKQMQEG